MSTSQKLPDNHPIILAWNEFTKTEAYINAKRWAIYPEHVDGSLWTAFIAGIDSPIREVVEQPTPSEKDKNTAAFIHDYVLQRLGNKTVDMGVIERLIHDRRMDSEDSKRLDWLEKKPLILCSESPGWTTGDAGNFQNYGTKIDTIRGAIDLAIKLYKEP